MAPTLNTSSPLYTGLTHAYLFDNSNPSASTVEDAVGSVDLETDSTPIVRGYKGYGGLHFTGNHTGANTALGAYPLAATGSLAITFKVDEVTAGNHFAIEVNYADNTVLLEIYRTGAAFNVRLDLDEAVGVPASISQADAIGLGWHTAVVTWTDGSQEYYLDGVSVDTSSETVDLTNAASSSSEITIGSNDTGVSDFNGIVGPLFTWSRRLSDAEVALFSANPASILRSSSGVRRRNRSRR